MKLDLLGCFQDQDKKGRLICIEKHESDKEQEQEILLGCQKDKDNLFCQNFETGKNYGCKTNKQGIFTCDLDKTNKKFVYSE